MEIFPNVLLGDVISFSVFENVKAVIPTKFENVKTVAMIDADSAKALMDPYTLHRNVYPLLASGTCPDDPYQYYYLKVQLPNKRYVAVGVPWINLTTLEKRDSSTAEVRIDNISSSDLTRLKDHLAAGGWTLTTAKMV
jgi:hypothetical protein